MNYSDLKPSILARLLEAIALINNPEVSPEIRQLNQEILFREVGTAVYNRVYDMNAFDFEIPHTSGPGIDDRYFGLAKVASDSVSAGNIGLVEYAKNYVDNMIGKAQHDAFNNAVQSGKHPTVVRRIVGETCKWCNARAGTYIDPPSEVFQRHGGCDCSITTSGFKTRNGQLGNYVKPQNRNA